LNDEQLRVFINSFTWTYAKTYAKVCPHEYIVKDKIDDKYHKPFALVVSYIREQGFTANYKGRSGEYYILDDHYYWTMGAPVEETTVLNRAKLFQYNLIKNSWVLNGEQKIHNADKNSR
jgi:hypothetical protein